MSDQRISCAHTVVYWRPGPPEYWECQIACCGRRFVPVNETTVNNERSQPAQLPSNERACSCELWNINIERINGPLILQQIRSGKSYQVDQFEYCPWCGCSLADGIPNDKRHHQPSHETEAVDYVQFGWVPFHEKQGCDPDSFVEHEEDRIAIIEGWRWVPAYAAIQPTSEKANSCSYCEAGMQKVKEDLHYDAATNSSHPCTMSEGVGVTTSLTDEFCETFPTKESCDGAMARFIPEFLPVGVDEDDPRVKQIQEWCRERRSKQHCEHHADKT